MDDAEDQLISAVSLVAASIVVRCIAADVAQAHAARDAFARYGKGWHRRAEPRGLTSNRPLLFTGADLARTDIAPARR